MIFLGGTRSAFEIKEWVDKKYDSKKWKDFNTTMADMVPLHLGGNNTSKLSKVRILMRVRKGQ